MLVNTEKGEKLLAEAKGKVLSEELSCDVLEKNKPLNVPTKANPLKEKYYHDMYRLSFDKLTAKYCGASLAAKLRRFAAKKLYRWKQI